MKSRHVALSSSSARWFSASVCLVLILATVASLVWGARDPQNHVGADAGRRLQDAWTLVQQTGSHSFVSRVTQTALPAPVRANIGQAPKTQQLSAKGQINGADRSMKLLLWDNPAAELDDKHALEVVSENGQTRGRLPGGAWETLPDFGAAFAPGGDATAWLNAARHVSDLGEEKRALPGGGALVVQRFFFSVDGEAFAANLAAQLEAEYLAKGKLGAGMRLDMAGDLRNVIGTGEAWLDADGLPLRTTMDLEFPARANGERMLVKVQTDFSDFDRSRLFLNSVMSGHWNAAGIYRLLHTLAQPPVAALLLVLAVAGLLLIVLRALPPGLRRASSLAGLSFALATSSFAVLPPPKVEAASAPAPAPNDVVFAPGMDAVSLETSAQTAMTEKPAQTALSAPAAAAATVVAEGPDADRDGLPDALEATWTTDVNNPDTDGDGLQDGNEVLRCNNSSLGLSANQLTGANKTWPSCSNPKVADTDADGLTDGQEVLYLGSSPNLDDSDGDGRKDISETLPVNTVGEPRYTDLLNADTDRDGLLDGQECQGLPCADADANGLPDVFQFDNDNDGFIGNFDASPNTVLGTSTTPFNAARPFDLSIGQLNPNQRVMVDFQIRPTNPNHIGLIQSVLDWPTGDTEGQIQRRLSTTFADVTPLPSGAPANDTARNGDMRMVPMLEIEMPGATAPLPRTTAATTATLQIAPLLAAIQFISETEDVNIFGLTVSSQNDMRVRISYLNPGFSGYALQVEKGTCHGATTLIQRFTPLGQNAEYTILGGELATIADGGHVAKLSATGLSMLCVPIGRIIEGQDIVPVGFQRPQSVEGTLALRQSGANVQATLNLVQARSGVYTVQIHPGPCTATPAVTPLASFDLDARGSATIATARVVDWADGTHVARVKQASYEELCAPLGNIVNGPPASADMIDARELTRLGIVVSEADAQGRLIAHVPMHLARDPRTGLSSGFVASMMYRGATQTTWDAQRVRMSWWVQVLTDMCSDPPEGFMANAAADARVQAWCGADANRAQLVHVYDEDWQLAGLTVREEESLKMDIIFEDPASDANRNSDDYLWHLAQGLDEQFVTGVDCVRATAAAACASDSARDLTIDSIYSTFHKGVNGGVPTDARWGIPNQTFVVEKLDTQLLGNADLGEVIQEHTPRLLNQHFMSGTVPRAEAPLLLFASESTQRSVALGEDRYAVPTSQGVAISFDPSDDVAKPRASFASISWAPFRHAGSRGWEAVPFSDYWDLLGTRLKAGSRINAGPSEDGRIVTAGKIRLAQTYFAYLYGGRANLVEVDGIALGRWDENASAYVSRQERELRVLDAGDLSELVNQGSLINEVIEPFAEGIFENFQTYKKQRSLMQVDNLSHFLRWDIKEGNVEDLTTLAKLFKTALGSTRDSLFDSFIGNFRVGAQTGAAGRWAVRGSKGMALASMVAGIASGILAARDGNGIKTAAQVLNGVVLASEISSSVAMFTAGARAAAEATANGAKASRAFFASLASTTAAASKASVVALVVAQVINLGSFIVQWAYNRLSPGDLALNQLFATSVANAIVAGWMFALASTGIGALVVALIGLIDGLVYLVCGYLSEEQEESDAAIVLCKGISGWLAELVSLVLYSQTEVTRIDDPNRLTYLNFAPGLAQPTSGFIPDAGVSLSMTLRNTLRLAGLPPNLGIFYAWQFSESTLKSARFAYDILADKPPVDAPQLHDTVERNSEPNPWIDQQNPGGANVRVRADARVTSDNELRLPAEAGLNRKVAGFLAEGYAVPVQECVATLLFPPPIPPVLACWIRSRKSTNYNDLNLVFDVFPPTLDGFLSFQQVTPGNPGSGYRQSWAGNDDLAFPALADADGDGLAANIDPDDTRWDADGDGLSDSVEVSRGSSASSSDRDNDGLPDVLEYLRGTRPDVADTDGDGLSDGEEAAGWSIGYGLTGPGQPLVSWAFSNPLEVDVDDDGMLDAQEKIYGFHPGVPGSDKALAYDASISERGAPVLLLRMDENENAKTHSDTSGVDARKSATCGYETCPVPGVRGRFGNAVHFNGSTDSLRIAPSPAIEALQSDFTVAAWVKPERLSGSQNILQIGAGGTNDRSTLGVGLQGNNIYVRLVNNNGSYQAPYTLPVGTLQLNTWAHIALASRQVNNLAVVNVRVNNVGIVSIITFARHPNTLAEITIGAEQEPISTDPPGPDGVLPTRRFNHFAGLIDEVVFIGWPPGADSATGLARANVQSLMDGGYNPNDGVLQPGQAVDYAGTMENALMVRALNGQRSVIFPSGLTTATNVLQPFKLQPAGKRTDANDFLVRSDAASGIYTLTQSINASVNTPSKDVWKDPASNKVFAWQGPDTFDGRGESTHDLRIDTSLNNKSFTMAAWVRPTNSDTQRRGILGRDSGRANAFPYLLTQGQQLRFGFGNGTNVFEAGANDGDANVLTMNAWNFVAVRYDRTTQVATFFVNGAQLNPVSMGAFANSPHTAMLIGRASDRALLTMSRIDLECEGDGLGDGEYTLIGSNDTGSLWNDSGTEPATWSPIQTADFPNTFSVTACEDDNDTLYACEGSDEYMGVLSVSSDEPSVTNATIRFSNPRGSTVCEYDWATASYPDIMVMTYTVANDALPFVGDVRDVEIHDAALSNTAIQNLYVRGDIVAQFQFDDLALSTTFKDSTGYHQLACASPGCPIAGADGKGLAALQFDGIDDFLDEGSISNNDAIAKVIADSNNGYALSVWVNVVLPPTSMPVGDRHNLAHFRGPSGSRDMEVNLVNAQDFIGGKGFKLALTDHVAGRTYVSEHTSSGSTCFIGGLGLPRYNAWQHVVVSVSGAGAVTMFINGKACQVTNSALTSTYRPNSSERFMLGRGLAGANDRVLKGRVDRLRIYRKPLTLAEALADYRLGATERARFDDLLVFPAGIALVSGKLGTALDLRSSRPSAAPFRLDTSAEFFTTGYQLFDGDSDAISTNNSSNDNPVSIAVWVKAESTAGRRLPILSAPVSDGFFNSHFELFLDNGFPTVKYHLHGTGSTFFSANKKVIENSWQHIVMRKTGSGTLSIFLNGYPAGTASTNFADATVWPINENNVGFAYVGGDPSGRLFAGEIDDLSIYKSALPDQEIREIFNYQSSLLADVVHTKVSVDAAPPTATLQLPSTYLPNTPRLLEIQAGDGETKVNIAELGVGKGLTPTWTGATQDATDPTGRTWLPLFEPSGDGRYVLHARAIDSVGNRGPVGTGLEVFVDGNAPSLAFNAPAGVRRPNPVEAGIWTLSLAGAVFDQPISGTLQPGSGVAYVDVSLVTANGQQATQLGTQRAKLTENGIGGALTWQLDYKLFTANPTGVYTASAVAVDRVGNRQAAQPIRVQIDATAPNAHAQGVGSPNALRRAGAGAAEAYPSIVDGDSVFSGEVDEQPRDVPAQNAVAGITAVDIAMNPILAQAATLRNQPLPTTTLLYLPLDESGRAPGADTGFADVSPTRRGYVLCTGNTCPQAGAFGRSGQALAFDGVNDKLVLTHTAAINALTSDFTLAAWIKPDTVTGLQRIVNTARTNSANGFGLGIFEGHVLFTTYGIQDYVSSIPLLKPNVWQHLAVRLAPDHAAEVYINGLLVERIPGSAPANADTDDQLLIGALSEFGTGNTFEHYKGAIDELAILTGAPTATDWEWLLGTQPMVHLTFDAPFIYPNVLMPNDSGLQAPWFGYYSTSLPPNVNQSVPGKVGAGALKVDAANGQLWGDTARGQLPHGNAPYTLAFWAMLANSSTQVGIWMGGDGGSSNLLELRPSAIVAGFSNRPELSSPATTAPNTWRHVALSWDGTHRTLYLDGTAVASDTVSANAQPTVSPLFLSSGAGALDDLRIYRHVLNAAELKALAQGGWRPATLGPAQSSRALARTQAVSAQTGDVANSWSAPVPAGMEGFYALQSRGVDALGNVGAEPKEVVTWRGTVDSLAPRLLEYSAITGSASIAYRITVEDFNLMSTPAQVPLGCNAGSMTITRTPYQSPWYLAMQAQQLDPAQLDNRTYRMTLECTTPVLQQQVGFILCDHAGNCVQTGPRLEVPTATPTSTPTSTPTPVPTATPTVTPTGVPAGKRVMLPMTMKGP